MTTQSLPANTVAAFTTLCGATVVMTADPSSDERARHAWCCLGCGARARSKGVEFDARTAANDHASLCRSRPLPTT